MARLGPARHPADPRGRRAPSGPAPRARCSRPTSGARASTGSGVGGLTAGLQAAGAALAYVRETQGDSLGPSHPAAAPGHRARPCCSTRPRWPRSSCSRRPRSGPPRARSSPPSTPPRTPMGARLLRQWMLRPLLDREGILRRQEAVGALVDAPAAREGLRQRLRRGGRPRAAHESRRPRGGPRARPDRAAGLPRPSTRAREELGGPRHPAPGDPRGGDHAPARPSETT